MSPLINWTVEKQKQSVPILAKKAEIVLISHSLKRSSYPDTKFFHNKTVNTFSMLPNCHKYLL